MTPAPLWESIAISKSSAATFSPALPKEAVQLGREKRPNMKMGICGEHGGDPASVHFCHKIGLNYVSCSPYRVPTARLAAAQAALEEEEEREKADMTQNNANP